MILEITIPGEIRGKGRPRFSMVGGKPRAFTDEKTKDEELRIRAIAVGLHGLPRVECPVKLAVYVGVTIPSSWSEKKKTKAALGEIVPAKKPDIDNYLKLVMDALNGVIWVDDAQVIQVFIAKFYQPHPCCKIVVML